MAFELAGLRNRAGESPSKVAERLLPTLSTDVLRPGLVFGYLWRHCPVRNLSS
jgi:hypothetical protein